MTFFSYFIVIVAFLDTFIQLPIITPYALSLGAPLSLAGGIVAIYSLTNMIGNVLGGHWIDRYGRKKMLTRGMFTVFGLLLLYPLAQSGYQLFIIRFLHGLAGGVLIPAAFAYIGDQTERTFQYTQGKSMAFTGASIGVAAIIGPAFGGIMAARSKIKYVFIFISVLFLLTALLISKYMEESFTSTEQTSFDVKEFIPLLKNSSMVQASLTAFSLMVSTGTLAFALPLNVESMGLHTGVTGILLSTFGIVALFVFLSPLNRIYDSVQPIYLIIYGLLLLSFSLFSLSFLTTFIGSFFAMVLYGLGFSLIFPSMNQIVAEVSTVEDRGKAYGLFYAFFSFGVVSGSVISGAVAEYLGYPFAVAAGLMVVSTIVLVLITKKSIKN